MGILNIQVSSSKSETALEVIDFLGKSLIRFSSLLISDNKLSIDDSDLDPGTYFILSDESNSVKFVFTN